jgi:hypothetical protein
MTDPREQLAELRTWLTSWSGYLAAGAAAIAGVLAADPSAALFASELVPEGWPRVAFVIAVVSLTYLLPLKAAKKDAASAENAQG